MSLTEMGQGEEWTATMAVVHHDTQEQGKDEEADESLHAAVSLGIILVLVACSLAFEYIKHHIEHLATKKFEHVVDKLFGEMTVLGFLSLCTFCAVQSGYFSKLSKELYGDEEELQEKFEFIHFALFFVMIIYVFVVTIMIGQAKVIEEEWTSICQMCHEPTTAEDIVRHQIRKSWWKQVKQFFFPSGGNSEALVVYYGLRKEFLLERQLEYPFAPKPKEDRLKPTFNFAMYLSRCLERQLEHIVEVHMPTWLFFALFAIVYYAISAAVDYDASTLAWLWIALEWFALIFCCWFHHHLMDIKKAMAWKISMTKSNALEEESEHLLDVPPSSDQLPDWCKINLDQKAVEKHHNRQQMLFWFHEHGPHAYLIILQINLVFTGIYWTMLFLVHFPNMVHNEPAAMCALYAAVAASPLLLWQRIARNLVGSITQVCSIGYLRKHDAVARVIRDQKVEAMIRAFLALYKILHGVEMATQKQNDKDKAGLLLNDSRGSSSSLTSLGSRTSLGSKSSLSRQARNEVARTFDAFDASKRGELRPCDMEKLLSSLGMSTTPGMIDKIVSALDTDGDGTISRAEFVAFYEECILQDDRMPTPKEKAHVLFSIFDEDGDEEITQTEFKETLEAFHLGFTLEDIGALLRELDEDGSGTISEKEFEHLIEKYFPKEAHRVSTPPSSPLKRSSLAQSIARSSGQYESI